MAKEQDVIVPGNVLAERQRELFTESRAACGILHMNMGCTAWDVHFLCEYMVAAWEWPSDTALETRYLPRRSTHGPDCCMSSMYMNL